MARKTKSKTICDGAGEAAMPHVIHPMLATLVDKAFSDSDWLFETKWDGVRAICFLKNGKARFVSRNQNELTAQYPELANIGDAVGAQRAILDGEIVALDEKGVSRFQLLQPRLGRKHTGEIARLAAKSHIVYYVFDLLYVDGHDCRALPLTRRKELLGQVIRGLPLVRIEERYWQQELSGLERLQS